MMRYDTIIHPLEVRTSRPKRNNFPEWGGFFLVGAKIDNTPFSFRSKMDRSVMVSPISSPLRCIVDNGVVRWV